MMLTDYQMYKRDYLASGAPRVGLLSCAQFKRAEERREHEESTLPARYALRKSCFDPPLSMDAYYAHIAQIRSEYSEKLRLLQQERAKIENEWVFAIARAKGGTEFDAAKRMLRDEGWSTKGQIKALKAEYQAALMGSTK